MKRGADDPSEALPPSARRQPTPGGWTFAHLGQVLGGPTGARLTRLLEVALEEEPAALALAWEPLTAFQSTHGPLERLIRDQAAPPVRRLAAFGALLAMSHGRVGRAGIGALTHHQAVWAAALLVTETEEKTGLDSLKGYGQLFLLTLCQHLSWRDDRTGHWTPLRDHAARESIRALALKGIPKLVPRCREAGQDELFPWRLNRALLLQVRFISVAVDEWLAKAATPASAAGPDALDPVLSALAALDEDGREEWIDRRTAAQFLGVEARTLQHYAGRSGFPKARLEGRRKLYPVLALIRWALGEDRVCWPETLPDPVRLALHARLPSTTTRPDGHALQDDLRKKRER